STREIAGPQRSSGRDFVAEVLDDGVAQEVAADLVQAGAEFGSVLRLHLELDQLADSRALQRGKSQARQCVSHRRSLGVQDVSFWRDKDIDFHGPLKPNHDALNHKTVKEEGGSSVLLRRKKA